MIKLTIDGKIVNTNENATILDAARSVDIDIPTMCHLNKNVSPVSCFVCAVKVDGADNFVPACATIVREGMAVDTCSDEVHDCRRRALELMLSEHAGDCEAPCTRICPCGLDIPEVIRRLLSGDTDNALATIRNSMPLPATLGRICPAPCEKGCRRAAVDTPVSIRMIHKTIAENAINTPSGNKIFNITPNSKNIAIVGSGPAGLSAAYFLSIKGYACTVFESQNKIGGTLRSQFDESTLPPKILDAEIELIENLGAKFILNKKINTINEIYDDYDAIIIAAGLQNKEQQQLSDLEHDDHGIKTCHDTLATSRPKVFACGSATRPARVAARSAGQGKLVAVSVDNYLSGKTARKPFSMNIGRLSAEEAKTLVDSIPHINKHKLPSSPTNNIISDDPPRCLQCDCGKKNSCTLRDYAAQYGAHHHRYYVTSHRKQYTRRLYNNSGLIHEPGKCTVCGRCVNITKEKGVTPGLSFAGRGSDVRVAAPFGGPVDEAMDAALGECGDKCPTGALWIPACRQSKGDPKQ